jgi:hypothetical protein
LVTRTPALLCLPLPQRSSLVPLRPAPLSLLPPLPVTPALLCLLLPRRRSSLVPLSLPPLTRTPARLCLLPLRRSSLELLHLLPLLALTLRSSLPRSLRLPLLLEPVLPRVPVLPRALVRLLVERRVRLLATPTLRSRILRRRIRASMFEIAVVSKMGLE